MTSDELRRRTKAFALRSIALFRSLPNDEIAKILGKQLVRCATSVGANYRAACYAKSTADMVNKLKMVEEESDEASYWIELIVESGLAQSAEFESMEKEATEIRKIMSASIKTLRQSNTPANRK